MSWDSNVYYHPEKHGLTVVAELEFSDLNYQYDTRVVWKDEQGNLYTARDSGCSCPTPFESYASVDDLEKVIGASHFDFEMDGSDPWIGNTSFATDKVSFKRKVAAALR